MQRSFPWIVRAGAVAIAIAAACSCWFRRRQRLWRLPVRRGAACRSSSCPTVGRPPRTCNTRFARRSFRSSSSRPKPTLTSAAEDWRSGLPERISNRGSRLWMASRERSISSWGTSAKTGKPTCRLTPRFSTTTCIRGSIWPTASPREGSSRSFESARGPIRRSSAGTTEGPCSGASTGGGGLVVTAAGGQVREDQPDLYQEARRTPRAGRGRLSSSRGRYGGLPRGALRPLARAGHRPGRLLQHLPGRQRPGQRPGHRRGCGGQRLRRRLHGLLGFPRR